MNKAILMGRLTKDPEVRYSSNAEPLAIARYTLAVDRRFKREGEADADFIPCVAFGKTGEFAEKYFKKGMLVLVTGRIQVRSWEDQTGQKRWSTEVVLEDQEFAESKSSFESRSSSFSASPKNENIQQDSSPRNSTPDGFASIAEQVDDDDDLPF